MKQNEIKTLEKLNKYNLANLFHVYSRNVDGQESYFYNIQRTVGFANTSTIPESKFDYYRIRERDTWPLISYNHYGTIRLWWLICKLNNVTNSMTEPEANTVIKILKKDYVLQVVQGISQN